MSTYEKGMTELVNENKSLKAELLESEKNDLVKDY